MDDATVGRAIKVLRIRRGWRQEDLAAAADVSQALVSRAERGHLETLSIRTVRALFAALDAGCTLAPWWRSGELDRLLDEAHAALVGDAVALLEREAWSVGVEVSFAIYGERGSIDALATRRSDGAALVVEVKSRLVSVEELLRTLDRKVRLAPEIVGKREGWRPRSVGRLVVLGEGSTNRRRVGRSPVLDSALPIRGDLVGEWLKRPAGPVSGLVFLSPSTARIARRPIVTRQRVSGTSARTGPPATDRANSDSAA